MSIKKIKELLKETYPKKTDIYEKLSDTLDQNGVFEGINIQFNELKKFVENKDNSKIGITRKDYSKLYRISENIVNQFNEIFDIITEIEDNIE